jgi:hypothetical protein
MVAGFICEECALTWDEAEQATCQKVRQELATFRRKIEFFSVVVNSAAQNKTRRGDRRAKIPMVARAC